MYPSVQSSDARVADAERFVSDVEDLVGRSRPGDLPPHFDRIDGPDRTGTVYAVVDVTGRLVDLGLDPGWWRALGPLRLATGFDEALESARMKASLLWLILRRHGVSPPPPSSPADRLPPLPLPGDDEFVSAVRNRIEDAYQLADDTARRLREADSARVVAGPRGLVRLHVRGRRIVRIEVEQYGLAADDTDRLVADARDAIGELARARTTTPEEEEWGQR